MKRTGTALKRYPTIGVCGLDCGLCPRYYTVGPSRCPGCGGPDFPDKHPSCSFITCAVKKKGLEVCAECPEFPCLKFRSDEEYRQVKKSSSYPPYTRLMPNQYFIKEHGIGEFLSLQKARISLLEAMIAGYDDGRSRSYYCRAAALLEIEGLRGCLETSARRVRDQKIKKDEARMKAAILRSTLGKLAIDAGVEL